EIERMLEESIEYAEQDFAERQTIEARTEAEIILAATQKALGSPQAANLLATERAAIDAAGAGLKESAAVTPISKKSNTSRPRRNTKSRFFRAARRLKSIQKRSRTAITVCPG